MDKSFIRHMAISKILRTPEQLEFLDNYTLIHGIYDDYGLEGMIICKDWDTPEGFERLISSLNAHKLRCRFNTHRNSKFFIKWISNDVLPEVQECISNKDFNGAKQVIISDAGLAFDGNDLAYLLNLKI